MDDRLKKTIENIKSWGALRQLESNIADKGGLNQEVTIALQERSNELGLMLIADKTTVKLDDLSPAEQKIIYAISEYIGVMQKQEKYPSRTVAQVRNRGLIDAAENSVCRARPTQGYEALFDADLEDLSYERIVLNHPAEFSARALWYSRRTLGLANSFENPPALPDSNVQSRTVTLLNWLKERLIDNGSYLPKFSNNDAAGVMDMEDMKRFGQAHGNIQSRIDFACYLCGLPPLGCAADVPFSKAWGRQHRDWKFPVARMQAAAQSRQWSASDFCHILDQTTQLPGKAYVSWTEAFINDEEKIKSWAFKFEDINNPISSVKESKKLKRNPSWLRDELILALNLYLLHRDAPLSKESAEVAELSNFLSQMGQALGFIAAGTYRNANGVSMKMMNFRRFDPQYTKDGKKGLSRGNKEEEIVWIEFAQEPERLAVICAAIRKAVYEHTTDNELAGADELGICDAAEGRVLTRMHRVRERSRKLVEQAKTLALKKHGRLKCEACNFDFVERYGLIGEGLIDVHHIKPVHTLVEGDRTRIEDLALLCANCHRIVHSSRKWLSVDEVASLVRHAT